MKYLFIIWMLPFMLTTDTCSTAPGLVTVQDDLFDLEYLVREQKDVTTKAPLLVLLHGYGSNEADLFSLSKQIPEDWLVVSARAPIEMGSNQYKWYNVKMIEGKIIMNFADEEKSRKSILKLIDKLVAKYKVDESKIVTAGFSQGSNMSLGLVLTEPEKILTAGCFSGRFMEEIKPLVTNKKALKSKHIFMSHGTKDTMLPLTYAEESIEILENWGVKVSLTADNVGHTISGKQLTEFVTWLQAL